MQKNNYKTRMIRKKIYIDGRIKEANIDKNIIVLLTGNGKGKSSSALGMVCRALGYKMSVGVIQFIKGTIDTGETMFLKKQKLVSYYAMKTGFTWETQDKKADTRAALKIWEHAKKMLTDPKINLVVLDEITYMLNYKYLKEDEVIKVINNRPDTQYLIITGRAASKKLIDLADTVSEVADIKHSFRANIRAQKGIEY